MSIIISSNTELICSGEVRLLLKVGPDGDIIIKPIRDEGTKYQFTMDDAITITSITDRPTAPPLIDADTNTEVDTNTNEYLSIRDRHVHNVHNMKPELIAELLMLQGIRQSEDVEYYKVTRDDVFPFRLMSDDARWKYKSIGCMSLEDRGAEVPYPFMSFHATRKRYIWEPFECDESKEIAIEINWLPYLDQLLIKTGAVMAGSYPLHHVIPCNKKYKWKPDDVDVFGLTLDFLRDIIATLITNDITFHLYLRRLGHVDSYKLKMEDAYHSTDVILNYLHIAHDGDDRPIDEEMDTDIHRAKVIKFILTSFDIAACATYYDGSAIHYNSDIDKMRTSVRGACQRRMDKYERRGFKLTGDLKDYTYAMYE